MIWVVDTNVISEMRKPKPNRLVVDWLTGVDSKSIWTTSVCLAEVLYGIEKLADTGERAALQRWYHDVVVAMFENRIYDVSSVTLVEWLKLMSNSKSKRQYAPPVDYLIASICRAEGAHVVTRDVAPFIASGVPTFNPWTGERFNGA
jgi:toxin FitB